MKNKLTLAEVPVGARVSPHAQWGHMFPHGLLNQPCEVVGHGRVHLKVVCPRIGGDRVFTVPVSCVELIR